MTAAADRTSRVSPLLHHIVIVGGGAAGLELATKLGDRLGRREKAEITLIERARTHIWKPHLHEVAAGTMDVGREAVDYLAQAADHCFRYRIGEMIGLDRAHREVHVSASTDAEGNEITPPRSVPYDTLVIAVGSTSNDFGTPGAKEFAISLDTPEQAVRFHQRLVNRFMRAHAQPDPVRPGQLHVAIIGAGATGTELAAELHRTTRQVVAYGLDRIDVEKDLKITLVEAAESILPPVPRRVSEGALRLLQGLGIDVRTQARVTEVRQDGVRLADGYFIPSELVVWAAGVKAPDLLKDLDGLEANRSNQLVVTQTLQTTRDTDVFAVGDCACLTNPGETRPVPPRAQAATHRTLHRHVRELGARVHAPEHERHPRLISPRLTNSAKKVAWAKTESSTSTYFAVVMLPSKMGAPTAAVGYFGGSDESARGRHPQQAFSCRFPKHTIVGDAASVPRSPSACQGGSPCRG